MRIDVLDHGYVELVETWGSEEGIIASREDVDGKGLPRVGASVNIAPIVR